MPVTAIVTGATGFLGRRLVASLLENEELIVRCLVRESSDINELLVSLASDQLKRVRIARGSLNDARFLTEQFIDADVIYHLAASLSGGTSTLFLNTVVPTRTMIEVAGQVRVGRFVLVSSLGVYGPNGVKSGRELNETTPIDPSPELRDPYTFSKVHQENVARALFEEHNVPFVVVRPGVIYGPGRSAITARVGLKLGPMLLRMGGGQQLPYVYVDNCAEGIKLAGLAKDIEGETFNLIDDDLPTGRRIVKLVRQSGQKVRSLWIPRFAIAPLSGMYAWYSKWSQGQLPPVLSPYRSAAIWKAVRYSNAKAKHKLNWTPKISTEEGLRRTIAG